MSAAIDKVTSKLKGKGKDRETLLEDQENLEKIKKREQKKQQRKEDYERLDLKNKTKFGMGGMQTGGSG
jgi:hypothetical protein